MRKRRRAHRLTKEVQFLIGKEAEYIKHPLPVAKYYRTNASPRSDYPIRPQSRTPISKRPGTVKLAS